jgi:effector-binding domain-containing protein
MLRRIAGSRPVAGNRAGAGTLAVPEFFMPDEKNRHAMNFLRKSAYSIAAIVLCLAVIGIILPSRVVVERSTTIDASRSTVFALLNDFHQVNKWSPWIEDDPNAKIEIVGPRRGVGATIAWDGNIVGRGSQTIRESLPYDRIVTALDLGGQGEASTSFDLSDTDDGTLVVWMFDMDFGFNLLGRYIGRMIDASIAGDYEKGLASLKSMAEGLPRADFSDMEVEHIVVEATDIAYQSTSSIPEATAISEAMGKAYFNVLGFIDENNLQEAGAPLSISRAFSGSEIRFDAGIPVRGITDEPPRSGGSVRLGKTYAGPVIRVKHIGSYRSLGRTHDKIAAYLAALGIERNGDAWESYVSDPTRTEEDELLTYVYYPIVVE